jgi:UMF2 family putative MFS family transporter
MLRLRQARLGVNGCIISGIVLGSLYGLMPLYLNHQGVSDSGIGFWMAVMVSAGLSGSGRLAVWRIALVACWCCAFRSLW